MFTFTNVTTRDRYIEAKKNQGISFEYVPNTATGYEDCRKYINANGFKYFLSANTEKNYFLSMEDACEKLSIFFQVDGDKVTIERASYQGRSEKADRYLKKYVQLLTLIHSVLKYDRIITFTDMCGNRWNNGIKEVA